MATKKQAESLTAGQWVRIARTQHPLPPSTSEFFEVAPGGVTSIEVPKAGYGSRTVNALHVHPRDELRWRVHLYSPTATVGDRGGGRWGAEHTAARYSPTQDGGVALVGLRHVVIGGDSGPFATKAAVAAHLDGLETARKAAQERADAADAADRAKLEATGRVAAMLGGEVVATFGRSLVEFRSVGPDGLRALADALGYGESVRVVLSTEQIANIGTGDDAA